MWVGRRVVIRAGRVCVLVLWGLLCTAALPADGVPGQMDAEEVLPAGPLVAAVLARLTAAGGLQADFLQINHWVVADEPDTARGVLSVSRDRFNLAYRQPAGHRVGCDGRAVWTYIPEEKQVLRAQLAETTRWGDLFVDGLKQAADSLAHVWVRQGRRWARIELGPRPQWGLARLTFDLDLVSANPAAYGYEDEEGNRTSFLFETVSYPASLADSLFRFAVPDGYELLELD